MWKNSLFKEQNAQILHNLASHFYMCGFQNRYKLYIAGFDMLHYALMIQRLVYK